MSNSFDVIVADYVCRAKPVQTVTQSIPVPTAKPAGRIWLDKDGHGTPWVFVAFDKSSPDFNAYLDKARALKHATPGAPGWSKADSAWVYPLAALPNAIASFPGFNVHPVAVAVAAKMGTGHAVDTTPPAVDGTVSVNFGSLLVQWEQRHPRFSVFLDSARRIKSQHGGTFNPNLKGWLFPRTALAAIRHAFPTFQYADSLGAATAYPPDDDRRQDWHADTTPAGPDLAGMVDHYLAGY